MKHTNAYGTTVLQSPASPQGNSTPYLRDFTHAAKIFTPAGYALSPKVKFLFHTFFDINPLVYSPTEEQANYGILVKTVKLPSYQIKTSEMNQYNRKRIVQTKISYEPINITFHDDSSNRLTKLWDAYYSYYFKDSTNFNIFKGDPGSANQGEANVPDASVNDYNTRDIYDSSLTGKNNWGYYGESNASRFDKKVKPPFFRNITVFGLSRHEFTAYTLINPMITRFDHDTYSYGDSSGTLECKMDINYETVIYNEGALDGRDPANIVQGFGLDSVYDTQLSPITPDGNNSYVPGPSNMLDPEGGFIKSLKLNATR